MALGIALAVVAFGSLTFGQIDIPLESCLALICHKFGLPFFSENDFTREQVAVIWFIRMPRMLVGL